LLSSKTRSLKLFCDQNQTRLYLKFNFKIVKVIKIIEIIEVIVIVEHFGIILKI
jgi:hypothetical protein